MDAFQTSLGYRSLDPLSHLEPQAKEQFSDEELLRYAKDLFDAHIAEALRSTGEWHWKLDIREVAEDVAETLKSEEQANYEHLRSALLEHYEDQYWVPTTREYRSYLRDKRALRSSIPKVNHQREQDEKLQPTSKWMPLKVHDNTVDIVIQRLQAIVDQYQQYLPALDELLAMTQHREFGSREATVYLHKFVQWQVGLEHEEIDGKILVAQWEIIQLSARDEKFQWPHYKVEYGFESDPFVDAQFTYIPVKMAEHFGGVEEAFNVLGLLQNGDGEKAIIIGDIDTTSLYTPDGEEYIVPTHDFEWASFFTGGEALADDSNGNFDSSDSEIVQVPDDLLDRIDASGIKDWEVAAKVAFEQWFWISRIHLVSQNTGGDSSEVCGNGLTQPDLEQQQSKLRTWAEKHAQECEACFIVQQREKNIAKS